MLKIIKYFAGFMSASVGFEFAAQLGFKCVLGNELNKIRAQWSREKFPEADIVQGSFTDPKIFSHLVRKFKKEGCRLATFSPCCQPYSKAGKQHLHSKEAFLFLYIIKFIKLTMAENAWIENALEFRNAILADDPRTVEQRIRDELEPLGYHIEVKIQDAAGFKTPQHRRRTIFLISRVGIWKHPEECEPKDYVTVRQTIDLLPSVKAGERGRIPFQNGPYLPKCQIPYIHDYTKSSDKINFVTTKGIPCKKPKPQYVACTIDPDKPANTIVQKSASITGFRTCHYRDKRCLTVLEIILLTGLPRDWFIPLWARNDEELIRDVLGECFAPLHVQALLQTMPHNN
jgi:DNA (cytosine-5)-methyltransferase 1